MALDKETLNNTLATQKKAEGALENITKSINTSDGLKDVTVPSVKGNTQILGNALNAQDEKFAKTATKIGGKAGEVLGGVKTLGVEKFGADEITTGAIGKLTDKMPDIKGLKTPTSAPVTLTGLPTPEKSSAIEAISSGNAEGIAEAVAVSKDKSSKTLGEISAFSQTIADADELSAITAQLPTPDLGDITKVVEDISPIAEISGKAGDIADKVSDSTAIGGLNPDKLAPKNALTNISSASDLKKKGGFSSIAGALKKVEDGIGDFADRINDSFDKGLGGFIQNIAETVTGFAAGFIGNIVSGGVAFGEKKRKEVLKNQSDGTPEGRKKATQDILAKSPNVSARMKTIIEEEGAKHNNNQDFKNAVVARAEREGVNQSEIDSASNEFETVDSKLQELDTTISGTLVVDASIFDEETSLTADKNKWSGRTSSDEVFTYVSSVEELDFELASITREISEVVIHASETVNNKNIGAIEINNIHKELGHDGIAFHYVIRRDGRLQRGRPVDKVGEHAPVNGHNVYSIGIVMVGGLLASAGSINPLENKSSGSFTQPQFDTLEKFLASFYRKYPGGQVFGHSDVDEIEEDPYFDVEDYIESIFNKKNTSKGTDSPLSPAEINIQ